MKKSNAEEIENWRKEAKLRFQTRQTRMRELAREQNSFDLQTIHTEYYDIPEEVLLAILQYLDVKSIASFCLVCRGWNIIQRHNVVWENLYRKKFRTIILSSGKETDDGIWRESYVNRMNIRLNWYRNVSHAIYMDMSLERYLSGKNDKGLAWNGVWKAEKLRKDSTVLRIPTAVSKIVLGRDKFVTSDQMGSVNVWDSTTFQLQSILKGHSANVCGMRILGDKLYTSCQSDQKIMIWDLNYGLCTKKIRSTSNVQTGLIDFDINQKRLFGHTGTDAEVLDLESEKHIIQLSSPHTQNIPIAGYNMSDNLFCTSGSGDGLIKVYDVRIKLCIKQIKTNLVDTTMISSFKPAFDKNNKNRMTAIVTSGQKSRLNTYDIGTGKELKSIPLQPTIYPHQFGYDDEKIVLLDQNSIEILNRDTGRSECVITNYPGNTCMDFDEGRMILANSFGEIIYMFFGGNDFYFSHLKGGRSLGTKEDKIQEE